VRLKCLLGSLDLNEAWRRGWDLKRVSQSVCNVKYVANRAREAWGPFIAPQCPGQGPDMSGQPFWNLTWGSDMSGLGLSH
jgi:hypothetical protein